MLKEVSPDDFLQDDLYVTNKLEESQDLQIQTTLSHLRQTFLPQSGEGEIVNKKFRYIDPLFTQTFTSGTPLETTYQRRLSMADKEFRDMLNQAEEENKKGLFVPYI